MDDLKEGQGSYAFPQPDNYVYKGAWKADLRHGKGVMVNSEGGFFYDGDWDGDYIHGQGTIRSADGTVY